MNSLRKVGHGEGLISTDVSVDCALELCKQSLIFSIFERKISPKSSAKERDDTCDGKGGRRLTLKMPWTMLNS